MKLINNQPLTTAQRAEFNIQLIKGINAALHHRDNEIELTERDIESLLSRCMQMNTGHVYQIQYHCIPCNKTPSGDIAPPPRPAEDTPSAATTDSSTSGKTGETDLTDTRKEAVANIFISQGTRADIEQLRALRSEHNPGSDTGSDQSEKTTPSGDNPDTLRVEISLGQLSQLNSAAIKEISARLQDSLDELTNEKEKP